MRNVTYKFAEQVEDYGFFGFIDLNFQVTKTWKKINLKSGNEFDQWRAGLLFGASYFVEHATEMIGLDLEIKEISSHEVDTNNTVIAYVLFQALLKAAGIEVRQSMIFDRERKCFILPK